MDIKTLMTVILTSTVVSSICAVIAENIFKRKNQKDQELKKRKEELYINLLSYMEMYLDPNSKSSMSFGKYTNQDIENMSLDEFKEMVYTTMNALIRRGVLYFTDELFNVIAAFVENPSYEKYLSVMISMRNDLGYKTLRTDSYKLMFNSANKLKL